MVAFFPSAPPLHFRPAFCIFSSPPLDIEDLRGLRVCAPELLFRGRAWPAIREGGRTAKAPLSRPQEKERFRFFLDCGRILAHDISPCFFFFFQAQVFFPLFLSLFSLFFFLSRRDFTREQSAERNQKRERGANGESRVGEFFFLFEVRWRDKKKNPLLFFSSSLLLCFLL